MHRYRDKKVVGVFVRFSYTSAYGAPGAEFGPAKALASPPFSELAAKLDAAVVLSAPARKRRCVTDCRAGECRAIECT
jgi:hypothetical protein